MRNFENAVRRYVGYCEEAHANIVDRYTGESESDWSYYLGGNTLE